MRENIEKRTTLKNLYSDIRTLLFKMIPEKWDSIYLYALSQSLNKNVYYHEYYDDGLYWRTLFVTSK